MSPRRMKKSTPRKSGFGNEVLGIVLLLTVGFITVSLYRPELTGQAGRMVAYTMTLLFGRSGALLVTVGAAFPAVHLILNRTNLRRTAYSMFLLTAALLIASHLTVPEIRLQAASFTEGMGGGVVGGWLTNLLLKVFGVVGTWVIVFATTVIATMGATGATLMGMLRALYKGAKQVMSSFEYKRDSSAPVKEEFSPPVFIPEVRQYEVHAAEDPHKEVIILPAPAQPKLPPEDLKVQQLLLPRGDYALPSLALLNRTLRQGSRGGKDERENIRILEEMLSNFGIKAKVVDLTRGPAYTRYEIQTAPGTKVSKVTSLSNDIAMSLASEGVRIEAPIPGKAAIGIEVPNKARSSVMLRDVLESTEFSNSSSPLTVALGKDIEGTTVIADLSQMPHLLIAGATGAGKSVCINALICSILYKARPDEVKFLLIDPKVVELATYNGIPHLMAPVLNHPKKAAAALKWATNEMERRYAAFAKAGVRDIERYNERAVEQEQNKIPFIVIIIDELADLMMVARADVEDAICRLAQMARAAGMHLVIGTQRPSTDVITGLIKANIPSRLSFTVSSSTDSRVILDTGGAEKLLGRGDMLFLPVGQSKAKRIQGAFVSNREIENIVDHVASQAEAEYIGVLNTMEEDNSSQSEGEVDDRFDEAVKVVVETGQASVSMLQRRMRLGYTRAARIVDQMQEAGIVGPSDGAKPRQINKNHQLVKTILDKSKRTGT
ncbi:MAG: DNA segregation ATPase FtsK/SpoIIIE S-DNA-T family [Bacillota bacterium]|nr:MAG: DNA segregation ATPase FtsK/SpoIIIE S-DNA-T family [Bacillota bacterium]MBS3949919.1 DNA translocase FtsK 4TM domain-containing protein [Peptococcaceae bacterium]